jgi:flavin-dependent dehydrogenase
MRTFDVAIFGSGPVGLIAALQIARGGRTVVVVTKSLPGPNDPRRVDATPATFLALLVELGVHPSLVGVDRLHAIRFSAWETQTPSSSDTPKFVHLERPALDLALLDLLRRTNIPVVFEQRLLSVNRRVAGDGWRSQFVIDATGRTAVTATQRIHPPRPWVVRTFWTSRTACHADAAFSIAALPDGYAYRLGAASIMTLGVVGRGAAVSGSPVTVECRLRAIVPWLLEGLPPLESMMPGATGAASAQWTEAKSGLRIGDAALARDALSSQGIATGASEALFAAAIASEGDLEPLRARQREQRQAHLTSLLQAIARSQYSHLPAWRDYREFVAPHIEPKSLWASAALRNGQIESATL